MNTEITASQKTALLKLPGFKDIQKQYAKEAKMDGGRRKRMRGRGFWDDVGAWFVQAGKDVNQFLKDTKLVSNIAAYALPILGSMGAALLTVNPLGAVAGGIAGKSAADYIKSQGYGATHRMPDGSLMKGKTHGMGIFPLAINPPAQRMRGLVSSKKMMKGGDATQKRLSGKGYGTTNNTFGSNGMPQKVSAPAHSGMVRNMGGKGKGMPGKMMGMGGTEYNTVSSEFGNVQF
jgi:hypothetical protein